MLQLDSTRPATFHIDDPTTEQLVPVKLRVKWLTEQEYTAFASGMKRLDDPPSLRLLGGRASSGEEQEKDDKGRYVISEAEIIDRRRTELTPERREAYDRADQEDEAFVRAFTKDAIERFVTVVAGELAVDGQPVTSGADLYRVFCARADLLFGLVTLIHQENTMSPVAKKAWRSLSDFRRISSEHQLAQAGQKLAEVAAGVETSGTANNGAATGSTEAPSGSAATSSSTPARSRRSRTKRAPSSTSSIGATP
jgi:hypothetical protein